jgi:hypothetical protein
VAAAKSRSRLLPANRTLLALVVVAVVAIALASYARRRPPGVAGAGPVASASGPLRATPGTGHVTGQAPASCRQRTAAGGQPLPDPACTPGVLSTSVTQSDIAITICRSGYAATVRPTESDSEAFKQKIMIAYREPGAPGDYELDHLVPLELGGSNDAGNLWPEPDDHPAGAVNSKDLVENALNTAVCTGKVTLTAAQTAIAADWTTALSRLGLPSA